MLDLNDMQVFARVAQTQSFTAAARQLGLPKSTVSRHLARLEQRLGVRLLERTTRRLSLTEAGTLYLRHCTRIVAEAEEAEHAVGALRGRPRGLLRVGTPVTFARTFLSPLLPDFLARYPEVRLTLALRSGRIDPIQSGLDVVIHIGEAPAGSLVARQLAETRLGLYASPRYAHQHGLPGRPAELAAHPCFTLSDSGPAAGFTLLRGSERAEVPLVPRVAVVDPVIHAQLVAAGLGIAALPEFLARSAEYAAQLLRVLPEWELPPVPMFALYPSRRSLPPKVRAFLDFLAEALRPPRG